MKKLTLFNQLIKEITGLENEYGTHSITKKDNFIMHCFGSLKNKDLTECKQLFAEHGWKYSDELSDKFFALDVHNKTINRYLTVSYFKDTDKISIAGFATGYAYAGRKKRYYPTKNNTPLFCYSKKMYSFTTTAEKKIQPRILCGNIMLPFFPIIGKIADKIFLNITHNSIVPLSYRYHLNTKNDYEVVENYIGRKIPKSLKEFTAYELSLLYRGIKNHNEINKLCQYISKNPINGRSISSVLSKMLFNSDDHQWLITDSLQDCITLKKPTLSLKVTSITRWEQEHAKKFNIIRLKGTPEFQTKNVYKNALVDFKYESELINDKHRLLNESIEMNHCVSSYAQRINNGDCAIFSINYSNAKYTLEVGILNDIYQLYQIRGKYNCNAPEELINSINQHFNLTKSISV